MLSVTLRVGFFEVVQERQAQAGAGDCRFPRASPESSAIELV